MEGGAFVWVKGETKDDINNAGKVQTPVSTPIIFIHSLIFFSIFQRSLPWSSALLLYLFTISNPFFSQSVSWPSVCDRAYPGTGVELLMPGEAERWFHCVFSCGDGWLSEAARGVLGRRASVENKYTCLLLMHQATLTAMQIKHSPPPNCLQYYSPIPTWIPTSQTLSHPQTQMRLFCVVWTSSQIQYGLPSQHGSVPILLTLVIWQAS